MMNDYRELQVLYKNKYKQKLQRQLKIVKPDATSDDVEKILDGQNINIFTQQLIGGQQAEAKRALEDIQEKHQEILKIERGILELHQLFVDMSILIETQGDMINLIEKHVGDAASYTNQGVEELKKAVKLQKKSRKVFLIFTIRNFVLL